MNCSGQRSNQFQGDLNRTPSPQADHLRTYANTKWTELLLVEMARRSISQERMKCLLHIRSEVKLYTFVNSELFCLIRVLF